MATRTDGGGDREESRREMVVKICRLVGVQPTMGRRLHTKATNSAVYYLTGEMMAAPGEIGEPSGASSSEIKSRLRKLAGTESRQGKRRFDLNELGSIYCALEESEDKRDFANGED